MNNLFVTANKPNESTTILQYFQPDGCFFKGGYDFHLVKQLKLDHAYFFRILLEEFIY